MAFDVPKTPESIEKIKDRLFDEYMKRVIMEDFYADLKDYFSDEEIDIFRREFSELSIEEFEAAISIPYELRQKLFMRLFEAYDKGTKLETVIAGYVSQVARYGYSIGYHTSPYEIEPTDSGMWSIKGTEADHRDDDRMMAYYSIQYRHLFKKRHPKFIYAVRSSLTDGSHKSDGNWHRGDSLSVIMKVPFEDVVNYVESTARTEERPDELNHRAA